MANYRLRVVTEPDSRLPMSTVHGLKPGEFIEIAEPLPPRPVFEILLSEDEFAAFKKRILP